MIWDVEPCQSNPLKNHYFKPIPIVSVEYKGNIEVTIEPQFDSAV